MTPRSNKLLGLKTKNTATRMPGQTCESTAQHLADLFPRLLCRRISRSPEMPAAISLLLRCAELGHQVLVSRVSGRL